MIPDDGDDDPELRATIAGYYGRQELATERSVDTGPALEPARRRLERSRARRKRRAAVVLAAAAVTAVAFAARSSLPDALRTRDPWVRSGAIAVFDTVPAHHGQEEPAKLASTRLTLLEPSGPNDAVAYFGRLDSVMAQLRGRVTFRTTGDYRAAHPGQCVSTVVVTGVRGQRGAVFADGASGWTAAEGTPSQLVSADGGVLHQQLIVPPAGAVDRSATFTASVVVDGTTVARTGEYRLRPVGRAGDDVWQVSNPGSGPGSVSVSCSRG